LFTSDHIQKLIKQIESSTSELEKELQKIRRRNTNLIESFRVKGRKYDEDLLKEWLEEYWFIYPGQRENEWYVAVPKFINFSVGWLDHTTKGYNVFLINRYTQWLGEIPGFLKSELKLKEPEKIFVSGDNVIFEEGREQEVEEKYGSLLSSVSKGTARVKRGREFDLIAQIIEGGSLPFVPRPAEAADIREASGNIRFDGKYRFQEDAWLAFQKYGAICACWMTGAGKDIVSTYLLDRIKVGKLPNLLVSPSLTILEQMKNEYFPKYAPRLVEELKSGDLILATYQSYDKLKDKEYGLIVFSESHMLPADTFSRLSTLKCKYRYGNTATPAREDKRESYIFALSGYPVGLNWQDLMRLLGKKYHDVNVYIVANLQAKLNLVAQLLDRNRKTILFVNLIDVGERLAGMLGVPFIHGETKNRLEIVRNSKVFVASRVLELGVSMKDLEHIIEVDFLFGSRREEIQRTGRLFHSEVAKRHDVIMTKDEFEAYGKRLHAFIEKGFRVNLKPMVSGSFAIRKPQPASVSKRTKAKAHGNNEIIDELFEEGFFQIERKFSEICAEAGKRGASLSPPGKKALNDKVRAMVKGRKLYKIKKSDGYVYIRR